MYLISDNRHYTFYIWKNFFKKYQLFRFFATPFYSFSILTIWYCLSDHSSLRKLLFFASISATLIPSPLLEPRYFIVPFFLFRIKFALTCENKWKSILFELFFFFFVDFLVLYLFLYKPFNQADDSISRFIWWKQNQKLDFFFLKKYKIKNIWACFQISFFPFFFNLYSFFKK